MCAEIIDEIILCDGEPVEDAHLIWTKLCEKFGQPKCDELQGKEVISNTITTTPTCCCEEKKEDQAYIGSLPAGQANPTRPGVYAGQVAMSARPGYCVG
jgi:hypothetical protein